jgi:putative oxidoreductase
MLAFIFIRQGFETFRQPESYAQRAEPVVRSLAERVPATPDRVEDAVRINGALQMAAGSLLALGRLPRPAAFILAATLIPTTLAGHRFWEEKDDAARSQQRIHLLKNLSMLGGLLIAAADTAGNPSVAWRTRHATRTARRDATLVTRTARVSSRAGARAAKARAVPARVSAKAAKLGARVG